MCQCGLHSLVWQALSSVPSFPLAMSSKRPSTTPVPYACKPDSLCQLQYLHHLISNVILQHLVCEVGRLAPLHVHIRSHACINTYRCSMHNIECQSPHTGTAHVAQLPACMCSSVGQFEEEQPFPACCLLRKCLNHACKHTAGRCIFANPTSMCRNASGWLGSLSVKVM